MTNFTFNGPGGQQITIDAPTHDDAVRQLHDRVSTPRPLGAPGHPATSAPAAAKDFGSTPLNFAAGVGQGLLDLPEGLGQLAEHIPYVGGAVRAVIPQRLRDWAKNYRSRAEASTAGQIGEFAGNVLPAFLQPELGIARAGEAVPYVGKALGFGGRVLERGTLPAVAQPVDTSGSKDDFWDRKKIQAAVGTGLGTLGETLASTLTRIGRSGAAQRAAQQKAESDYNAQLAAHHTGTLARAAEQTTRAQAKAAKDEIPNQTTLRWQKETLDRIGLGDQAPTAVTPEASARVQKLVGDRLNEIIGRMQLDRHDPSFTDTLATIRHDTMGAIPESAQTGFYKSSPEAAETPLLYDQYGRPISRFTRSGEPPKPTGDWVRTVEEPLAKGNLSGRQLSDYISRLGARAEELARDARVAPQDKRAELYAMSNAYRQVEDAVIGHAAGSPEDKLALEQARKAYSMWSIGNDAGRAAKGGVMTPSDLIRTVSRRMSEARYKQALADPKHPDNALFSHLQQQLDRLKEPLPPVRPKDQVPPHPRTARPAPQTSRGGQAIANALTHYALWHAAGPMGYFAGRHVTPSIVRRVAPVLSRTAGSLGRGMRRLESPTSRAAGAAVEQSQETPSMSFKWPD